MLVLAVIKIKQMRILIVLICLINLSSCKQQKEDTSAIKTSNLSSDIKVKMAENNLTGISIAVIEDYKISWSKEFGVKEANTSEKIDENTAFSTASISKAFTATICLILDERNIIDIDVPVRNYLKRWKLPESEYFEKTDLTIRHLLSHTGGTTHSGYADFYEGDSIPNIIDCLNGKGLPNYETSIEIEFEPGTNASYSGGGYVIVQLALEDMLNKPFEQIAEEVLIQPLNLNNTSMLQPNEKGFFQNVAKCHDAQKNKISTGLPICPQLGPSGLWSSSKNLAQFAIETQKALNGQKTNIISQKVAKELTEIATYKYMGGGALGWQRSFGFGNNEWLSIMGSNTGVGGEINISLTDGRGIVMLGNGEMSNRLPVFNFIRNSIMEERNWNKEIGIDSTNKSNSELTKLVKGVYLDFLYGDKNDIITIFEESGNLYLSSSVLKLLTDKPKNEMYYAGNNEFIVEDYPNRIKFNILDNSIKEIGIYRNSNKKEGIYFQTIESLKTIEVDLVEAFSFLSFENAKKKYYSLKQNNPNEDFTYKLLRLGITFYKKGENDLATKLLEFNCIENPKNLDAYETCAEIYERLGELDKSIKKYEQLLKLLSSDKDKEAIKTKINELKATTANTV